MKGDRPAAGREVPRRVITSPYPSGYLQARLSCRHLVVSMGAEMVRGSGGAKPYLFAAVTRPVRASMATYGEPSRYHVVVVSKWPANQRFTSRGGCSGDACPAFSPGAGSRGTGFSVGARSCRRDPRPAHALLEHGEVADVHIAVVIDVGIRAVRIARRHAWP
jgi:hypothetical protein